jgi:hypothetical protein
MRAARKSPAADVRFLIFQARKLKEDSTGSRGQMSALNRVAFEKHMADAKKRVQDALVKQVALWAELSETKPDITRCHKLSSDMFQAMVASENAFQQLLELNSQSLLVLRLYADFTMYVVNNQDKANTLIAEAERIEDQQSKEHQRESGAVIQIMEQSNLDILADNTAIITIGASFNNLGIILNASPYTTKLFGHSRWQLERRNVGMLIPAPISELHDMFLHRYLETGEGNVVDYTRVVLGLHRYEDLYTSHNAAVQCIHYLSHCRAGHIFPLLLCVREQAATDGPPAFIGIMRTLATSEQHIMMKDDYIMTAVSQGSLVLLNIEPSMLQSGGMPIQEWIEEWPVSGFPFCCNRQCECKQ